MIGKIIKSLAKQLVITAIVISISIAIMSINPTAGIILMMLYSSWMVIKSSNKEMPLNKFTALLPGIMSLAIFIIMLGLIGVHDEEMPLIGLGLGIIPGWLMARGHKVYKKNGIVYAKRTFFYVFIWTISIIFTQGSTLLGMREVTDFGFLLNGFSTAMMVVLSVILLLRKSNNTLNIKSSTTLLTYTLIPFSLLIYLIPVEALEQNKIKYSKEKIEQLCNNERWICPGSFDIDTRDFMCNSHGMNCPVGPICLGHKISCYNTKTKKYSQFNNTVLDKNDDGVCDMCGDRYRGSHSWAGTYRKSYKHILTGNKYSNCSITLRNSEPIIQRPHQNPYPPSNSEFEEFLHNLKQLLHDFQFSSSDAEAAGAIVSLMLLLTSLGLNASIAAAQGIAQGAASAAGSATQRAASNAYSDGNDNNWGYDSRTHSNGTLMLDGAEAEEWMKDKKNGYLDKNGNPTEKFQEFMNSLPSEKGSGLHGFAGKIEDYDDDNGKRKSKPVGNYVIIVDGETPDQTFQSKNSRDTDEQPENTSDKNQDQSTDSSLSDSDNDKTRSSTNETKHDQELGDDLPPDVDRHKDTLIPDDFDTQPSNPPPPPGPTSPELVRQFKKTIKQDIENKIMEDYYVMNRTFDVFPIIDEVLWVANTGVNNIGEKIGSPLDWLMGWKGGRCGEYGEWGNKWSKEICERFFGKDTIITQITAISSDLNNHNASRIITPNGDRFVIDYWQGMLDKQAVYTEDEWIKQQADNGRKKIVRTYDGDEKNILNGGEEGLLNKFINKFGDKEGIKKFMSSNQKSTSNSLSLGKRQALVLSYQKAPWPTK